MLRRLPALFIRRQCDCIRYRGIHENNIVTDTVLAMSGSLGDVQIGVVPSYLGGNVINMIKGTRCKQYRH
jgi:hypothetical protein